MKKKLIIIISLLIVMAITSSCSVFDYSLINETYKPELEASPINGVWKVSKVVQSSGNNEFSPGNKFYFDVELYAGEQKLFLNPDFEVLRVNLKKYLDQRKFSVDLNGYFNSTDINVIEVIKNREIVAEIIPLNRDKILLYTDDEIVELVRLEAALKPEEILLIKNTYNEYETDQLNKESWGVLIGLRTTSNINSVESGNYTYSTLIFKHQPNGNFVGDANGIVIKGQYGLNVYDVVRKEVGGKKLDSIIKDNLELTINDENGKRQSNLFRITYLSPKYMTLEYLFSGEYLNTLSVYSTDDKEGLIQQKSEDLIGSNSDKLFAAKDITVEGIYGQKSSRNIGLGRENGLLVLKGREPIETEGKLINKDYVISSDINYVSSFGGKLNFQEIKRMFPNMVDVLPTPSNDYIIIVFNNAIEMYRVDLTVNKFEKVLRRDIGTNSTYISMTWINEDELNSFEDKTISFGRK